MRERWEKEEERKKDRTCITGREVKGEEWFLKPRKFPPWWGDWLGEKGSYRGYWRTETYADRLCPNLKHVSTSEHKGLGIVT